MGRLQPTLPAASLNPLGFGPRPRICSLDHKAAMRATVTILRPHTRVSKPWTSLFNTPPPRCSGPGQTLPSGGKALLGSPIPGTPLPYVGSPPPLWEMRSDLWTWGGGEIQMQRALQSRKPETQLHFMPKRTTPRLGYPEPPPPPQRPRLQLQIRQNKAKPSYFFFLKNLERAERGFVFPQQRHSPILRLGEPLEATPKPP